MRARHLQFLVPGPNCHMEFLIFSLLRALFLPRAPHLQAAFSRKLSSCNEHVAEANFSRPHPPTSRVLCTVPTQSSKLERSEKQLNFLVRETCAHYMHFLVPGPNCHTEFLTFSLLRAFFLPRAPHLQAAFSRELFNLEPSVIDAVRASSLGCLIRPGINLVGKTGLKTTTKELSTNSSSLPPTPPHPEV